MKIRRHMVLDPHYWRKGLLRAAARASRKVHVESLVGSSVEVVEGVRASDRRRLTVLAALPQFDYGDPARGLSYEENNFFHSLVDMGHRVIRFDFPTLARLHGRAAMNKLLLEAAYRTGPDVAFFSLFADEFEPESVQAVSAELGIPTVNWFSDDQWRFDRFSSTWAPSFDFCVTTSATHVPRYLELGTKPILSQWAANPALYFPSKQDKRSVITFFGQPYGKRRAAIRALRDAGIPVICRGQGWPGGKCTQREMVALMGAGTASINFTESSVPGTRQVKGRTFEIPACGTVQLTEPAPSLNDCFEDGVEFLSFEDIPGLVSQAKHILATPHEARNVAERGLRRCMQDHTYAARFDAIFGAMGVG